MFRLQDQHPKLNYAASYGQFEAMNFYPPALVFLQISPTSSRL